MMDADQLRALILERDPIDYDPGCGCCGGDDRCGWCGGPRTYHFRAEPSGPWTRHTDDCPWVAAGGDPGPEPVPLPEEEGPRIVMPPVPTAFATGIMEAVGHPTLDLVRTPPPRLGRNLAIEVTSTAFDDVDMPEDEDEGDGPGFTFADPATDDPVAALTVSMAKAAAARMAGWFAVDELAGYARRDRRDLVVTLQGGAPVDAYVGLPAKGDEPKMLLLDEDALAVRSSMFYEVGAPAPSVEFTPAPRDADEAADRIMADRLEQGWY